MFALHPQLAADTHLLGAFDLSLVLLSGDSRYPWCLLVPQRPGVTEIHHLGSADRHQLLDESCRLAEVMTDLFAPRKMNVAAIGNRVSQLHLHHIARFEEDATWPDPVWGRLPSVPYGEVLLSERLSRLRHALRGAGFRETDCPA